MCYIDLNFHVFTQVDSICLTVPTERQRCTYFSNFNGEIKDRDKGMKRIKERHEV